MEGNQNHNFQHGGIPAANGSFPRPMGGATHCQDGYRQSSSRSSGSIYNAFEYYEREARQRKYMIAEMEDKISNLEQCLVEVQESNKNLEIDCEKLEMECLACEATYEKNLTEKSLVENEFRALSREMDAVAEDIIKKNGKLAEIQTFRAEKIKLMLKTEEKYMSEYRKHPAIAKVLDIRAKCDQLEHQIIERNQELEEVQLEVLKTRNLHAQEWKNFKKNCVKVAGTYVEIINKRKSIEAMRKELNDKRSGRAGGVRQLKENLMKGPATKLETKSLATRFKISARIDNATIARSRRSLTFQQMDHILNSSQPLASNRQILESGMNTPKKYQPMSPIARVGSSLVSKLRSRLKGTVLVSPMPRNPDGLNNRATVAVAPTRSENIDEIPGSATQQMLNDRPRGQMSAPLPRDAQDVASDQQQTFFSTEVHTGPSISFQQRVCEQARPVTEQTAQTRMECTVNQSQISTGFCKDKFTNENLPEVQTVHESQVNVHADSTAVSGSQSATQSGSNDERLSSANNFPQLAATPASRQFNFFDNNIAPSHDQCRPANFFGNDFGQNPSPSSNFFGDTFHNSSSGMGGAGSSGFDMLGLFGGSQNNEKSPENYGFLF